MKSNNKSGVTGISYDKGNGVWVSQWNDVKGNQCKKWYSLKKHTNAEAKAMAIEHRQRMIWSLPHYREALRLDPKA